MPFENDYSGAVNVIYGSPAGLSPGGNQIWSQASKGIAGTPEGGIDEPDCFGWSLAAGSFGHDQGGRAFEDLAIRVPGESSGPKHATGIVQIVYGSLRGLAVANNQTLTRPGSNDGWTIDVSSREPLTAANYGHSSGDRAHDDLVIGNPSVDVIDGSGNGVNTKRHRILNPSNVGHPELWFGFGDALAS